MNAVPAWLMCVAGGAAAMVMVAAIAAAHGESVPIWGFVVAGIVGAREGYEVTGVGDDR